MPQPEKHKAKPENHDVAGNGERDELGRWQPGTSGNPAGRPRGPSLRPLIEERLLETPEGLDGRSLAEELVRKLIGDAIRHDGPSRKMLVEMLEGRPRQSTTSAVELTTIVDDIPRVTDEQHRAYAESAIKVVREAEARAQGD